MYKPKHKKFDYENYFSYYDIKESFDNILKNLKKSDFCYLPAFFFYDLKDCIYKSNTRRKDYFEDEN